MTQTTFANGRGIAHQGSGGMSIAFPDVCKTPAGPAVVPIPYPNVGKASDTSGGPAALHQTLGDHTKRFGFGAVQF